MKKIIINESDKSKIMEYLSAQKLPSFLIDSLRKHKTSLGNHPSFPPESEDNFDEKIILKRFEDVKNDLSKIEDLDLHSNEELRILLNKLIKECQERETPIRNQLEKICINTLNEIFNIPQDTIVFSCKLCDKIENKNNLLRITPEEIEDIEFDDIIEMENVSSEVYKRRLIDSLNIGAAMYYAKNSSKYYLSDIFELDNKLPELYSKIISLNNYLMFVTNVQISDKNNKQDGTVNVTLGNIQSKSKIECEAIIFPILLSESIKGFMEIFSSHGLPEKKDIALYVIKKSDFLLAEPWDMRFGYILWTYLLMSLKNDKIDSKMIPYIYNLIVKLPCNKFFKLMKEIFGKTKKGKEIMKLIYNKVEHDIEMSNFDASLSTKFNDLYSQENTFFTADEL